MVTVEEIDDESDPTEVREKQLHGLIHILIVLDFQPG